MVKIIILLLFDLGLIACQEDLSYSYLVEHPTFLQMKVAECQTQQKTTDYAVKQCVAILTAAADVDALLNEQRANPQQFGFRIMIAEIDLVIAKRKLIDAKQSLKTMESSKVVSSAELVAKKKQIEHAQMHYQEISREVNKLLLVVSVNDSPV